jgi:hypothetical protein
VGASEFFEFITISFHLLQRKSTATRAAAVATAPNTYLFQLEWTKIPKDFILDKEKWSKQEVNTRLLNHGHALLTKGGQQQLRLAAANIDVDMEKDFTKRCYNLRDMTIGLGKPRVGGVWAARFNRQYPDYKFQGGRQVKGPDDLIEAIISQPFDNEMRGLVHFVQNRMWGRGNVWAVLLENKIKELLKLEYTDDLCDVKEGAVNRKNHQGGSIKRMMVRLKQSSFVNKFRRATKLYYNEVLYLRDVGTSKDILEMVPATIASHGFQGTIGLTAGHPDLGKRNRINNPIQNPQSLAFRATAVQETSPSVIGTQELHHWFDNQLKARVTTREELFASLQSDPAGMHIETPPAVDDDDGGTTISPFSDLMSALSPMGANYLSPLAADDWSTVTVSTFSLFSPYLCAVF